MQFELLAQAHVLRAMLSGPNCNDGVFTPSDNWTGNNDSDNKLAAKGVCVSVCLCNSRQLFNFTCLPDRCGDERCWASAGVSSH